ncbi:MAG: hypothetical protein ACRC5A_07920 [Enterobacteriaceae bacterium]
MNNNNALHPNEIRRNKEKEQERIEIKGLISGVMFNPQMQMNQRPHDIMGQAFERELSAIKNAVIDRSRKRDRLSIHKLREMIEDRARRAIESNDPNQRTKLLKYIYELYNVAMLIQ